MGGVQLGGSTIAERLAGGEVGGLIAHLTPKNIEFCEK